MMRGPREEGIMAAIDDWAAAAYTSVGVALAAIQTAKTARLSNKDYAAATTAINDANTALAAITAPPA